MSILKQSIISEIIEREGGYVLDLDDSGGETKYGITVAVARAFGYKGDMRDLPRDVAVRIYSSRYWEPLRLDEVEAQSVFIAQELADTAVNMGVARAATFLQRSLNVLNQGGDLYPDLAVDARVGPMTIHALTLYLQQRGEDGETVLNRMLNALQGAFYVDLAERREKDEKYISGWFLRRVS